MKHEHDIPSAMTIYEFRSDGQPAPSNRPIGKNLSKLTRPWESPVLAGNFIFSHGHFLVNAKY